MKYRVHLAANNICDKDGKIVVSAVSAKNAKAIAAMRFKAYTPTKAIRLSTEPAPVKALEALRVDFIEAKESGNKELAAQCEKAFYHTLTTLQRTMNVVDFQLAKKELPNLPPMAMK